MTQYEAIKKQIRELLINQKLGVLYIISLMVWLLLLSEISFYVFKKIIN